MIRKDLGLESEPFIIENGGAVIIPYGYFSGGGGGGGGGDGPDDDLKHHYGVRSVDGYSVIETWQVFCRN